MAPNRDEEMEKANLLRLVPDYENWPDHVRAEIEALAQMLGPNPSREAIRQHFSPEVLDFFLDQITRAAIIQVSLHAAARAASRAPRDDAT